MLCSLGEEIARDIALPLLLPCKGRLYHSCNLFTDAGIALEAVADLQKLQFKKVYGDTFCDEGLYRYCKHPNYLGEIMTWVG